jgi:hypothetical protein
MENGGSAVIKPAGVGMQRQLQTVSLKMKVIRFQ